MQEVFIQDYGDHTVAPRINRALKAGGVVTQIVGGGPAVVILVEMPEQANVTDHPVAARDLPL